MLSVDPGSRHCGVALWNGASCYEHYECTPDVLFERLEDWLLADALDEVVVEDYQLYAWKSKEQHFSKIPTIRVIGVLEWMVSRWGTALYIEQPASVKKQGFNIAAGRGIEILGSNQHVRDSWVHGFVRLRNRPVA